ncbi:unnamed protein product, partial [Prunus brigantina]
SLSLPRTLSLSLPSVSLSPRPVPSLSSILSAPATARDGTGPVGFVSSARSRPAGFPRLKTRFQPPVSTGFSPVFTTTAQHFPARFSVELGAPTDRTQQAGPSRGQAAWDYL